MRDFLFIKFSLVNLEIRCFLLVLYGFYAVCVNQCVNQKSLLKVILYCKFVLFNKYLFKCSNIILLIEH